MPVRNVVVTLKINTFRDSVRVTLLGLLFSSLLVFCNTQCLSFFQKKKVNNQVLNKQIKKKTKNKNEIG